jgi:hypothetical protein
MLPKRAVVSTDPFPLPGRCPAVFRRCAGIFFSRVQPLPRRWRVSGRRRLRPELHQRRKDHRSTACGRTRQGRLAAGAVHGDCHHSIGGYGGQGVGLCHRNHPVLDRQHRQAQSAGRGQRRPGLLFSTAAAPRPAASPSTSDSTSSTRTGSTRCSPTSPRCCPPVAAGPVARPTTVPSSRSFT